MSKRYPRRFKSDSEGCYIELPASDSVGIVVTPHYRQPLEYMTEEWLEENRVETFDHHDKDENGMYQLFSAACPSPANSETATLRAEVERLTKERDELREKLAESEAAAAKMREAISKWMSPEERRTGVFSGSVNAVYDSIEADAGREFLIEWDAMKAENSALWSQLETERGHVEGLQEGCEFLKQQVINTEKRWTDALADIDQIGQWLSLPPDLTVERILEEIDYVREKARGSYHDKWKAELQRQLNEAWMRVDYTTADRIADLLGVPKPSDHEKADLQQGSREVAK